MIDDHKKVINNNLLAAMNMIMACCDKLEEKTTNGNASGVCSSFKQPEFGMPLNFYENQNLYAAPNKVKSTSLTLETDKASLAGSALSNQMVIYSQNSSRNTRTDQRVTASRASVGQSILPILLKSPSQIHILDDRPTAHVAHITNFNDSLNQFKEELSRSLQESLGVQIKPSCNTLKFITHEVGEK